MAGRLVITHSTVYLYPNDIKIAKVLGAGNISKGVRIALQYTYRETGCNRTKLGDHFDATQSDGYTDGHDGNERQSPDTHNGDAERSIEATR